MCHMLSCLMPFLKLFLLLGILFFPLLLNKSLPILQDLAQLSPSLTIKAWYQLFLFKLFPRILPLNHSFNIYYMLPCIKVICIITSLH